uniref:B30.2/SPRY domain-containing protein n=1 Tax=Knipowitschia caucasica TaxID=637954 RepID=A0AAV2KMG3_KNICA
MFNRNFLYLNAVSVNLRYGFPFSLTMVMDKKAKEEEEEREKRLEEDKKMEEDCDPRRFKGRPGQVRCDICTKMAATKSCLICLTSYCDDDVQNHLVNPRFSGHKLVDPVEDMDQRACLAHGRPLELYSRVQRKCICVLCKEVGEEGVVSTEDACSSKKAEIKKIIEELKESIVKREEKIDTINASQKIFKDQLDSEWWDIDTVFSEVKATLEAAQAKALGPVEERRQRLNQEASEVIDTLKNEVDAHKKTIKELQDISTFEDHVLFLQKYNSLKEPGFKDWTTIELDTSVSFGSLRKVTHEALEQIQEQMETLTALELQRLPKFAVDLTLDPNTSHKRLVLSQDHKEAIYGEMEQEDCDGSERFDIFGSVLGREELGVGSRAYWEVQVGAKTGWDLGVASAKAERKGKISLSPNSGYWAMVHYEGDKYAALTAPPLCVELNHKPEKVGVFLDYDEGLLSFYDVANKTHIYSYRKGNFVGALLPYFSPHVKDERNTEPLIISDVTLGQTS